SSLVPLRFFPRGGGFWNLCINPRAKFLPCIWVNDKLDTLPWRRPSLTRVAHGLDVERNRLGNEPACAVQTLGGSDAPWQIGHINAVPRRRAAYHDEVTHPAPLSLFQSGLPQYGSQRLRSDI